MPFTSWAAMARVLPDLIRLKSYRSVYGLVAQHVRDPRIRFVLSFHSLFVGGNPFSVTSIYGLISFLERRWGVHFPMGGMGKLVEGLTRLIETQGGKLRYGAEVEEILVDDRAATGVRLTCGEVIKSDIVVSNADSAWTYRHLVPSAARRRWSNYKIDRARYSMGLFVWYFGTSRRYRDIPHHTILLGPRYRELLQDIFQKKRLADDMSLYSLGSGDMLEAFVAELGDVARSIKTGKPSTILSGQLASDALTLCFAQRRSLLSGKPVRIN